jgi:pSer/pThr/pTyr-binding forkhead associated (FHA) protein
MKRAKLKFEGKAIDFSEGVITLGRVSDNAIAFPFDSNVSRYHAEIEMRGAGEFWLIDLKSSNGTTVNDRRFESEKLLNDGDVILLGGTSKIEFLLEEVADEAKAQNPATGSASPPTNQSKDPKMDKDSKAASKMGVVLIVAGIAVGLAVIFVIAAVIFSYTRTTKCEAKAVITKPEPGETITELTEIEVEVKDGECVARAIFLVNGGEFADAIEQPFKATIDPKQFPELANGSLQSLKVVLEDAEGNKIVQPGEISVAFETIEIAAPSPSPTEIAKGSTPAPQNKTGKNVSIIETQEISKRLVKEFSGSFDYKTSNPQFLQEVQKKTQEYAAAEGYFARAQTYKDVINVSFVQEQNLDAPLGYILAMSRSQFKLQKGEGEGLWQMDTGFAVGNSYTAPCGTETLSDTSQSCAAKATALYLKALILGVFEGDTVYAVAAFGKSPQEASIWKASLPADRSDFWNVIKEAKQREQVVRFFAAGAVAENPQKFGLKKDRPISELYRTLMSK